MKFELKPTLAKLDGAQGNNARKKKIPIASYVLSELTKKMLSNILT